MLNLRPHYRPQLPNSLALFAGLLLLISAAAGLHTSQEENFPDQETGISASAAESEGINTSTKRKTRGLNLGLLLFRRG